VKNEQESISRCGYKGDRIKKAGCWEIIDGISQVIPKVVGSGEKVSLVGFGTFYVTERKARNGRNPRTGKTINIPARKLPKFRAGKNLKNSVE